MRMTLFCLLLFCCGVLVAAQPDPPRIDPTQGTLRGLVKGEDGLPCPGVTVRVLIAGAAYSFSTDKDGGFGGNVRPGDAEVTALTAKARTKVVAGETCLVNLLVKRLGVVASLAYPDGTPLQDAIYGVVARPAPAPPLRAPARILDKGVFWFPDVPATATGLTIYCTLPIDGHTLTTSWSEYFPFPTAQDTRLLTMKVPAPAHLLLKVIDAQGQALPNLTARAHLSFSEQTAQDNGDGTVTLVATQKDSPLDTVTTDEQGRVDLGVWPPLHFILALEAGERSGRSVSFELRKDGVCSLEAYSLATITRTVTQIVFDAANKPAPGAEVFASYCWGGKVGIRTAKSDAQGRVTWNALPPVRTIVWGPAITPGVLPAAATNVVAPLPAPKPEGRKSYAIKLKVDGVLAVPIAVIIKGVQTTYSVVQTPMIGPAGEVALRGNCDMLSGAPVSLVAMVGVSPPLISTMQTLYPPYVDEEGATLDFPCAEMPLSTTQAVEIHGTLTTKDGLPVPAVCQLDIKPLGENDLWRIMKNYADFNFLRVVQGDNGSFRALLPAPGSYRLLVDLFDDATSPAAPFVFTAKPGVQELTFVLPAPLLTVNPGSELRWIAKSLPRIFRTLRVNKGPGEKTAIYGPADQLAAVWYAGAESTLTTYLPTAAPPGVTTTKLRRIRFLPQDADGRPLVNTPLFLLSLFPVSNPDAISSFWEAEVNRGRTVSETNVIQLPAEKRPLLIWPGQYAVCRAGLAPVAKIEVPDQDDSDVRFTVPPSNETTASAGASRLIRYRFPDGNYAAYRRKGNQQLRFAYDKPFPGLQANAGNGRTSLWANTAWEGEVMMEAPRDATRVSIQWAGVGVMTDIPLPPPGKLPTDSTLVALPAWQTGAAITGKLLSPDGNILPNMNYSATPLDRDYDDNTSQVTDRDGRFGLQGLLPGAYVFRYFTAWSAQLGYLLDLPAAGLRDVELPTAAAPVYWAATYQYSPTQQLWWLPDDGAPVLLPHRRGWVAQRDMPPHSGWLWNVDGAAGHARLLRTLPGWSFPLVTGLTTSGLGMTFPYDPAHGVPGAVRLDGKGALAGVTAQFPTIKWLASPQLGVVTAQIDAVPQGDYTLNIATPAGNITTPITVGEGGAVVALTYPK